MRSFLLDPEALTRILVLPVSSLLQWPVKFDGSGTRTVIPVVYHRTSGTASDGGPLLHQGDPDAFAGGALFESLTLRCIFSETKGLARDVFFHVYIMASASPRQPDLVYIAFHSKLTLHHWPSQASPGLHSM